MSVDGMQISAHRYSLMLYTGVMNPSKDMYACHKCDNKMCVHPLHLYWGDAVSNAQDYVTRRESNQDENIKYRLSESDVIEIRSSGLPPVEIAKNYNVDDSTVYAVIRGDTWKHLLK